MEILRFSAARLEAADEERWAAGSMMALAFNDPKQLSRLARERREEQQAEALERANVPTSSRLLSVFASAGLEIKKG